MLLPAGGYAPDLLPPINLLRGLYMREHPIRRRDRILPHAACRQLLDSGRYCVLATVDSCGQPYAVPLSYVFWQEKIWFHCAHQGHKIENLQANPRCSLSIVGDNCPVYAKNFTTYYESVTVFGEARAVCDDSIKTAALMELARKYLPEYMDRAPADIAASLSRTAVYAVSIDKISGKAKKKKLA